MRRHIAILLSALFLMALAPLAFAGEVIDGVVATVNRKPVLRSQWDEAVRFEAFMHQKRLAEVGEQERFAALQRLIDRELLDAQMTNEKGLRPSDTEVEEDLAKLREKFHTDGDVAKWQAMMQSYGLTQEMIAAQLKDEVQVMNFIDVQLRPNVRIQETDVEAYYRAKLVPDLKENGGRQIPLDEVAPKIRELLVQQHMDEMLEAWMHNLRQQSHIQTLVPMPTVNAALGAAGSGKSAGNN
jgi:peptidyl-prolyl cis-trans isomerase SurA